MAAMYYERQFPLNKFLLSAIKSLWGREFANYLNTKKYAFNASVDTQQTSVKMNRKSHYLEF